MRLNCLLRRWGLFCILLATPVYAQTTAFTYQGRLADNGTVANGSYDLQFTLLDSGSNSVAGPLTNDPVAVSNGLFTVQLDFGGDVFDGRALWLQMGVRTNGSAADYTILNPAQPLTAAPYAITAGNVPGGATTSQLVILSNATAAAIAPLISTNDSRPVTLSGGVVLTNNNTSSTAPLLQLQTGSTVPSYIWNVPPLVSNSVSGNFGLNLEGAFFNGDFDNVATLGWNQSAGGNRVNSSAPAMWLQWEQYYHQYSSQAQSEFHLDYIDSLGDSDRPFMFQEDATNLNNWQAIFADTHFYIRYPLDFADTWLSFSPSASSLSDKTNDNGIVFNMSAPDVVYINAAVGTTNANSLVFGSGNPNWASITFNTISNGSLAINNGGMTYSGFAGHSINNNSSGFDAIGSGTGDGDVGYLEMDDNTANTGRRNWVVGNFNTRGNYGGVPGALNFNVSGTAGGDVRTGNGAVVYSLWRTNSVNWTYVNNFNGGIWLPNTNITTADTAFTVATNQQMFAVTITAANQYAYVTNTAFTTNTYLQATLNTDDVTASSVAAIPTNGYCTLKLNAPATGAVRVSVQWQNP